MITFLTLDTCLLSVLGPQTHCQKQELDIAVVMLTHGPRCFGKPPSLHGCSGVPWRLEKRSCFSTSMLMSKGSRKKVQECTENKKKGIGERSRNRCGNGRRHLRFRTRRPCILYDKSIIELVFSVSGCWTRKTPEKVS